MKLIRCYHVEWVKFSLERLLEDEGLELSSIFEWVGGNLKRIFERDFGNGWIRIAGLCVDVCNELVGFKYFVGLT